MRKGEELRRIEVPLVWKTDPSEMPADYANLVTGTLTEHELSLVFSQRNLSHTESGDKGTIVPVAKLALPLGMLPDLVQMLERLRDAASTKPERETRPKRTRPKERS